MSLYVFGFADGAVELPAVRTLRVSGISVLVAAAPRAPRVSTAALRRHDRVLRGAARAGRTIIPVRFGTVVKDAEELAAWLRPVRAELLAALRRLAGTQQMTVRVFGRAEAGRGGPGTRHLAARTLPPLKPLREALSELVLEERVDPASRAVFHLVPRGSAPAYRRRARATALAPRGIHLEVTGPHPPYAFVPELT